VGHIEDVVVDAAARGQNLGKRLIEALVAVCRDKGCYKVILDCAEKNVAFYEKCGLTRKEVQMVRGLMGGVSGVKGGFGVGLLCCAVLCCAVLCCAVLCCAAQACFVLAGSCHPSTTHQINTLCRCSTLTVEVVLLSCLAVS